jgi:hypothetical protein
MSDVVNIGEPEVKLSPEREAEIYESSMKAGRKIGDALARGVDMAVDAKTADLSAEVEALKARVERLERLLAPRLAEGPGE